MSAKIKQEVILLDDAEDNSEQGANVQGEEDVKPAVNRDEDYLVPLGPSQMSRLPFPPRCSVVYTDFSDASSPPVVVYGKVVTAFLDIETREGVYKLDSGEMCPEASLQLGRGAKVWALLPTHQEYVAATVLQSYHARANATPLLSVQVLESSCIHHSVSSSSVCLRRRGSKAPPAPEAAPTAVAPIAVVPEVASKEAPVPIEKVPDEDGEFMDTRSERESRSRSRREESRNPSPAKRRRSSRERLDPEFNSVARWSVLLPAWLPVPVVKAKLLEAQKPLEHRFKCHILLRGAAFETAPSRPVLMYVDLEGGENGLQQAMECIEDILLDCFPRSMHAKRILMYDLAVGNPELYRHEDGIVYQRDPRRLVDQMNWIWICVLPFPQNFDFHVLARILIGSKGNGISEIRGETSCDISVPKSPTQPRPFVYIAGEALSDVRACVGRTHKRFDRAMKKCKP